MSSLVRTIQRTVTGRSARCKAPHYLGRGSKLGFTNPRAKDLLARRDREGKGNA